MTIRVRRRRRPIDGVNSAARPLAGRCLEPLLWRPFGKLVGANNKQAGAKTRRAGARAGVRAATGQIIELTPQRTLADFRRPAASWRRRRPRGREGETKPSLTGAGLTNGQLAEGWPERAKRKRFRERKNELTQIDLRRSELAADVSIWHGHSQEAFGID